MIKIKIYSAPFCVYCNEAKDFFDQHALPYTEVDVSVDEEAAKDMVSRTNQMSIPVIEIGDEIITGFDKSQIKKILRESGVKIEE